LLKNNSHNFNLTSKEQNMSKEIFFKDSTIRQYVNGDLEGQLLIDFERELKANEDLKTEVELAAFLVADYNLNQKKRLRTLVAKDTIIQVPKDEETEVSTKHKVDKLDSTKVKKLTPNWIKMAAAALVFLALGVGLFMMTNQNMSSPQLAQNYLEEPYAAPVVSRGESAEEIWNEAIVAYKKEDYNQAVSLIQQIVDKGEAKDIHRFYLGLSQLYKNNSTPKKAIEQFQEIKSGYYFDSAKWYEGLAYLKLDNQEQAKAVLSKIKDSSRSNEVSKLLDSL